MNDVRSCDPPPPIVVSAVDQHTYHSTCLASQAGTKRHITVLHCLLADGSFRNLESSASDLTSLRCRIDFHTPQQVRCPPFEQATLVGAAATYWPSRQNRRSVQVTNDSHVMRTASHRNLHHVLSQTPRWNDSHASSRGTTR